MGFSQIGIAGVDLEAAEAGLKAWLDAGFHGSMHYMAAHGMRRARPAELRPGTLSVISARIDYLPASSAHDWIARETAALADPTRAVVSVYARGRDYHKVLRRRLAALAARLEHEIGPLGHRVYADSAPVLEVELATRAAIGWRGKHTLLLAREGGSMSFLGEIYVDLELPPDVPTNGHCGRCSACIDACPTGAIVAPYRLDARRCIAYLTIEHPGPIPRELRPAIGNRVAGCDDCQLVCPWNKFARRSRLPDFDEREPFGAARLAQLWQWDAPEWERRTEGSALRRIGHERWRRNLAVAIGNALRSRDDPALRSLLAGARADAGALVREHIDWALEAPVRERHGGPAQSAASAPGSAPDDRSSGGIRVARLSPPPRLQACTDEPC